MTILLALSLLAYVIVIHRVTRWSIEVIPFFLCGSVIFLFYLFAYYHCLQMASLIFIGVGWLLFLTLPFLLYQQRTVLWQNYFTPGLVLFIFFSVGFGIISEYSITITNWDEVVRWLGHAKILYYNSGLFTADNSIVDKGYPPGGALFYYLFLRLSGYSEGSVILAQLILTLAPLILLLKPYSWKQWSSAALIFITSIVIIAFLFHLHLGSLGPLNPTSVLMMDQPTGLFFGATLAGYFILRKSRWLMAFLIPSLSALILLRPMNLPFALVVSVVVFFNEYIESRLSVKLMTAVLSTAVTLFVLISWNHYAHQLAASGWSWGWEALWNEISLSTQRKQVMELILLHYFEALLFPVLFVLLMMFLVRNLRNSVQDSILKKQLFMTHLILLVSFVAYLFMLLIVYLFQMPPELAIKVRSLPRFISIYYTAWLMVLMVQLQLFAHFPNFVKSLLFRRIKQLALFGLMSFVFIYTLFFFYEIQRLKNSPKSMQFALNQLQLGLKSTIQTIPVDAKVFLIWKSPFRIMHYRIADDLLPREVSFSFVDNLGTEKDLKQQLSNYDYLLLGPVSKDFWNNYKHLLSEKGKPININLCTASNFIWINDHNCTLQPAPFRLYKITKQQNNFHLQLVSTKN